MHQNVVYKRFGQIWGSCVFSHGLPGNCPFTYVRKVFVSIPIGLLCRIEVVFLVYIRFLQVFSRWYQGVAWKILTLSLFTCGKAVVPGGRFHYQ